MGTQRRITRRDVLKSGGALVAAVAALEAVGPFSFLPERANAATSPSDTQFDISAFLSVPPQTFGSGVEFQMPPVHTVFLTAALTGTPTFQGQSAVSRAVERIEEAYPWGAASLVTFVSYGLPYFAKLPGGLTGSLVSSHMPRLASDSGRYVLEEAVPGPTDISSANPGISKL